jgi:hypothetical protein
VFIGSGGDFAIGEKNISLGNQSLQNITSGSDNIAIGFGCCKNLTSASNVTAAGASALENALSTSDMVIIGNGAMAGVVTGENSIAIGVNAGRAISGGGDVPASKNNIFIGNNSQWPATGARYEEQIVIGNGAVGRASHTIQLGATTITQVYRGSGVSANFTTVSDPRVKEEISEADLEKCLDDINSLPVKRFKYKDFVGNEADIHLTGFLSTDFGEIFPKAITKSDAVYVENGETLEFAGLENIDVSQILPTLVGAVQKMSAGVAELKSKINA